MKYGTRVRDRTPCWLASDDIMRSIWLMSPRHQHPINLNGNIWWTVHEVALASRVSAALGGHDSWYLIRNLSYLVQADIYKTIPLIWRGDRCHEPLQQVHKMGKQLASWVWNAKENEWPITTHQMEWRGAQVGWDLPFPPYVTFHIALPDACKINVADTGGLAPSSEPPRGFHELL
jgi:hypothetical protein